MTTPHSSSSKTQLARLFTSRAYPVHYLVIPKCGCTFVKNFLWTLDTNSTHDTPIRIHDDDSQFLRADALGLSAEQIIKRDHAFTVLRNPIDRFFSLYADKVIGTGWQKYVPLRQVLTDHHGLDPDTTSIDGHRRNCTIMIDWIARNFEAPQELENEAHWTRQSARAHLMRRFDLKLLVLNKLDEHLPVLLGDLIPETGQIMAGLERNRTAPAFTRDDVLDQDLRRRINDVYAQDRRLFNQTKKLWQSRDPRTAADVPRFSEIDAG